MQYANPACRLIALAALALLTIPAAAQYKAERFNFEYDGLTYAGYLDYPPENDPKGLIVLIPGHGCTSVTDGDTLRSHRKALIEKGWTTAIWDRAGCGDSEGEYDHSQPVEDSALEAIAALESLRAKDKPGVEKIGIWSLSRGGWIAPLAIERDRDVDFWISVSGPSHIENFPYMLETNIRLDGRSREQARKARDAWLAAQRLVHDPEVDYETYSEREEHGHPHLGKKSYPNPGSFPMVKPPGGR